MTETLAKLRQSWAGLSTINKVAVVGGGVVVVWWFFGPSGSEGGGGWGAGGGSGAGGSGGVFGAGPSIPGRTTTPDNSTPNIPKTPETTATLMSTAGKPEQDPNIIKNPGDEGYTERVTGDEISVRTGFVQGEKDIAYEDDDAAFVKPTQPSMGQFINTEFDQTVDPNATETAADVASGTVNRPRR